MKVFQRSDATAIELRDEGTLAELGYKQELRRDWNVLHNFGVSFSIISVIGKERRIATQPSSANLTSR